MAKAAAHVLGGASPMPAGPGLIDLAVGHPAPRNLPHAQLSAGCRRVAARLLLGPARDHPTTTTTTTTTLPQPEGSGPATSAGVGDSEHAAVPLGYADNAGTPGFLKTAVRWLSAAYGSAVHPRSLVTTNGVSHGLDLACAALSSPGDLILLEEPCYFLAKQIFTGRHLRVAGAPTDASGIDTTALAAALASGAIEVPTLVYVIPSHSNPCGTELPLDRRAHLVKLAGQYGFTILSDDVYHLLGWSAPGAPRLPRLIELDPWWIAWQAGGCVDTLPAAESGGPYTETGSAEATPSTVVTTGVVVSVSSFTKILSPALRLGWIEAAPDLAHRIAQNGVLVSGGGAAAFTSEVVADVIRSGDQDVVLAQLCAEFATGCAALCDALEAAGCFTFHRPQGGYFVWVALPDGVTTEALVPHANKHGVTFLSGSRCGVTTADPPAFNHHIRLCFAYETPERLKKGATLLAAAVADVKAAL
jgi:2-aminoadipate transaminase